MGPLKAVAVVQSIADVLAAAGEIYEREIDEIALMEGAGATLGITLEDGVAFYLKVEPV